MKKTTVLYAFCDRNGRIYFGARVPETMLAVGSGPAKKLREVVAALARYSYPKKPGGRDQYPLVPGVPEAKDQNQAVDAVVRFFKQVKQRMV